MEEHAELTQKVGLGGGCHWCTEGIFRSVQGVEKVEQGWLTSISPHDTPSEAAVVYFVESMISLSQIINIHLLTHSCTSTHSLRHKYRSAVYTYSKQQTERVKVIIDEQQKEFVETIVTLVIPARQFELNQPRYLDYFYTNTDKPFCQTQIKPKLTRLLKTHGKLMTDKAKTVIKD